MEKKEKSSSYSHILKYMGVFGGVQGLGILIGLVRNKLIALILGPDGVGLISLFNSIIKLVSDFTNLGISTSAVRTISEHFDTGDERKISRSIVVIRSWSLLTAVLGMLVCVVFSQLLDSWTFSWGDHTLHIILLSPTVALMAVTGGEIAILKSTRQLRSLAVVSVYHFAGALVLSVPVICYWGEAGIVPSMFITALWQMFVAIRFSCRRYPFAVSFGKPVLREGGGMIRLGVAFVLAAVVGSASDFAIRSYLNNTGSLGVVGLYNAGYMMSIVYGGMIFSAMETDYFPRLAAINSVGKVLNDTVNRQIEASLLIIAPLLVVFMVGLPVIIPLLYSNAFMPVAGMMHAMILALYMRAIKLPLAYMPLARGDSLLYLVLESAYAVVVVALVVLFYDLWGLTGTGYAMLLTAVLDFVMLSFAMYRKYGFVFSRNVARYALLQVSAGLLSFAVTFIDTPWLYWLSGVAVVALSFSLSAWVLRSKANLVEQIRRRFFSH
ncbi:oligosaccharide flippase family protein [Prevotella sp. PCHR]|uniref:Oligosaccharide flippase family protein n=1 Tax=Xylanibacter caecicola TaxID=2736294 RepID=A0ABX2B483_9BACT|nr:oligosaccharide flippase family protein [Xylanibacter caecicola]NPE24755.1 oligosaccharide flippase family protein [Xylanibacter caecicola]